MSGELPAERDDRRPWDEAGEFDAERSEPAGVSFDEISRLGARLVAAAWRNKWLLLAIVGMVMAAGLVVTLLITPQYEARASVQIDQQTNRVLGTEEQEPPAAYQDADRFLQTNLDVLRSRATAMRVAQSLNLFAGHSFIDKMEANFDPPSDVDVERARREFVLELLMDNTDVYLRRDSRVANITFRSPDPQLSARVANAYADAFIIGNLQRKFNSTSYARSFLQEQLDPAREKLQDSERLLVGYARQAGLINIGTEGEQGSSQPNSVTISSLVALNGSYVAATANRIAAEQRWRTLQSVPAAALPEVLANPAIQEMYRAQAEKRAALAEEMKRHTADYPTVVQERAELAELERQIEGIVANVRRSIDDQYRTALQQERSLEQEVQRMKTATLQEQDRSIEYNILKRNVDSNRSIYEALLQRYKEMSAAAGVATNNISVVDRADAPLKPSSPKLLLNLLISAVLGFILGAVVITIREFLDDRVQNQGDVERKLRLGVLGLIPKLDEGEELAQELQSRRSQISESFQSAAAATLLSGAGAPKIITLVSGQPSEGKTSSCIGLAAALARLGRKVLLIECDLRRPSLADKIGFESGSGGPGLSEYLSAQADRDAITRPSTLGFDVIVVGALPPNPVDLLASPRLAALLAEADGIYDHVILDSPPVLGLADAPILASNSDAVLLVIEANRKHRGRAKAALSRLRRLRAPVVGAILTKVEFGRFAGMSYDLDYYSYGKPDGATAG